MRRMTSFLRIWRLSWRKWRPSALQKKKLLQIRDGLDEAKKVVERQKRQQEHRTCQLSCDFFITKEIVQKKREESALLSSTGIENLRSVENTDRTPAGRGKRRTAPGKTREATVSPVVATGGAISGSKRRRKCEKKKKD